MVTVETGSSVPSAAGVAATVGGAASPSAAGSASKAPSRHNLRLVLDGSLEAALTLAVPDGKPRFVLATFGNLGVKDQLANFVRYCGRAGAAHVVGAVDGAAHREEHLAQLVHRLLPGTRAHAHHRSESESL